MYLGSKLGSGGEWVRVSIGTAKRLLHELVIREVSCCRTI